MPKYTWANPREWLEHKIAKGEISLQEVLTAIIDLIDMDDIQDIFQEEMDCDGYFNDLDA